MYLYIQRLVLYPYTNIYSNYTAQVLVTQTTILRSSNGILSTIYHLSQAVSNQLDRPYKHPVFSTLAPPATITLTMRRLCSQFFEKKLVCISPAAPDPVKLSWVANVRGCYQATNSTIVQYRWLDWHFCHLQFESNLTRRHFNATLRLAAAEGAFFLHLSVFGSVQK